jgi:hypothetical protein
LIQQTSPFIIHLNQRKQKTFDLSKQTNGNVVQKIGQRQLLFQPTCIQATASRGLNNLLGQILNRRNLNFWGCAGVQTACPSILLPTLATVRTHLASIYARPATGRQSDIIRLAAQLVSPAGLVPDVR